MMITASLIRHPHFLGPKDPNAMHPTISRLRKWLAAVNGEGVFWEKKPKAVEESLNPSKELSHVFMSVLIPSSKRSHIPPNGKKSDNHSTPQILGS